MAETPGAWHRTLGGVSGIWLREPGADARLTVGHASYRSRFGATALTGRPSMYPR